MNAVSLKPGVLSPIHEVHDDVEYQLGARPTYDNCEHIYQKPYVRLLVTMIALYSSKNRLHKHGQNSE
jgi:hypothetical protein